MLKRIVAVSGAVVGLVLATGAAAFAHSEFDPNTAVPGSVVTVTLHVENERSDAGTTGVDLRFPENRKLVVAEVPAAPGWTITIEGGQVGGEATGVKWERAASAADPGDDPALQVRLGPLPGEAGRVQFKMLQTYSNGDVDRWVEDWPAGAAEPEHPGPVLDLVGASVTTTTAAGEAAPTSVATTAPATTPPTTAGAAAPASDSGGSNTGGVIAGVVVVVVIAAIIAAVVLARRRPGPTPR